VRIDFADGEELNEVIPVFQVSEAASARVFIGVLRSDSSPLVFTGGLFNESRDSLGLRCER
jgi:hypothetical protein